MEILFCDECGARITGEAPQGAAPAGGEQKKRCEACRAKQRAAKPSNRQLQPARARSERSIPAAPASAPPRRSSHAIDVAAARRSIQESRRSAVPMVVGVVVLALGLIAGAIALSGKPEPVAARKPGPDNPGPLQEQPAAVTPTAQRAPEASRPAPPASSSSAPATPSRDSAQEAEEAFAKLQRFDGLGPDDREGRIRRIEAFLTAYGQEIIAARARVMLRELQAPPPTVPVVVETPAVAPAAAPAEPVPPPSTDGWTAVSGPFTFEDGQLNRWDGDLGSRLDVGEFEGRKSLRLRPGDQRNCRAFRGPSMDSAGVRVRFRYFAHDVEYVEVLWAQGAHRPRKHIEPLVQDRWTEVCFTGAELGGNADRLRHVEIGGPAKSGESFLLLDDVVWEKQ